jgi:hypothetical protein
MIAKAILKPIEKRNLQGISTQAMHAASSFHRMVSSSHQVMQMANCGSGTGKPVRTIGR